MGPAFQTRLSAEYDLVFPDPLGVSHRPGGGIDQVFRLVVISIVDGCSYGELDGVVMVAHSKWRGQASHAIGRRSREYRPYASGPRAA